MTKNFFMAVRLIIPLVALVFPTITQAQYFSTPGNGDLVAGFRKTGLHQGTNELIVFLGNVTNLIALPMKSTLTMGNVAAARLTDAFSSDYTYLQWSVFGANYSQTTNWMTPLGDFPHSTLWYTVPRTNLSAQTEPHARFAATAQNLAGLSMWSIANGANTIGSQLPGGTNADNNTLILREPFQQAYSQFYLTAFMGDRFNTSIGDLGGSVFTFNLEQLTPGPFSAPVRSDLYEAAPAPSGRPPSVTYFVDPISGNTTHVYYVGYFELSPAGVLTFTREAAGSQPPPPPLAPQIGVSIAGAGGSPIPTISFGTTNGVTYTVIYTSFSAISAPRNTWQVLGSPVAGTGGTATVSDTNPAADGRVYSVRVQ
jgi:hypothetical protein